MFPDVVLRRGKSDLDKWPPLWPLRFANQAHMRFTREPIALARVTRDARANHVFPCRRSSAVARHYVIEVEFAPIENFAAVLAGVLVALENVVARKLHFLLRETIEKEQHNHARDSDLPRDGRDHFVFWRGYRKIAPTFEIVRQKIAGFVRRDDVGMARIDQRESASRRADVHRLPQAIEHQNLTV